MPEPDKRNRNTTSQVLMKRLNEFLDNQKKPVSPIPENGEPSMADQIWNAIPPKLRNICLILLVCGGGVLGGGSTMGVINAQSPVNGHATKTNEILIEIKEGQKEHSDELRNQSKAQAEFNTEQKLHSQAIMGLKEDITEMKADVKENRNHEHQ